MGHLLIPQDGASKRISMPDAMVQAMDAVVLEQFSKGFGVALEGIRKDEHTHQDTDTRTVTTMWLSPGSPLAFEYERGTDEAKTAEHINGMRQTFADSGRIRIG